MNVEKKIICNLIVTPFVDLVDKTVIGKGAVKVLCCHPFFNRIKIQAEASEGLALSSSPVSNEPGDSLQVSKKKSVM
jgi:hypothetical protein